MTRCGADTPGLPRMKGKRNDKGMKYPKRVTVIELENAPFRCAKDAVVLGTQMPSAYANFRPIRCGYDAAFRGYATTRIGRACVLRASDANLGEKCLWRSPRVKRVEKGSLESQWRGRRSHSAFRQTLRIAQAICVQKRNIEVMAGIAEPQSSPTPQTSMDVSILLNGVCDVNGEPLLK